MIYINSKEQVTEVSNLLFCFYFGMPPDTIDRYMPVSLADRYLRQRTKDWFARL